MTHTPGAAGFTRTEFLIVVALTGILAAIAIPRYGDYQPVAQAREGLNTLLQMREPLVAGYAASGRWPPLPPPVPHPGNSLPTITLTGVDHAPPGALQLTATLPATPPTREELWGKSLSLATRDGGRNWSCVPGTVERRHLPLECRDGTLFPWPPPGDPPPSPRNSPPPPQL